jgi:catechol 2,3-dioxygenase-like lactoylglutathione lyase family enzyme
MKRLLPAFTVLVLSVPTKATEAASSTAEHGRFHHVHLNVSDATKTAAFYEKVFGVVPVKYAETRLALMAERSFVFLTESQAPITSQLQTGLIHIGWSGIDGANEFAWWQKEGVEFHTPLSKIGPGEYFYLYGPDREVIEIWTNERHHRLNHVHMLAASPQQTAEWFARVLNSENGPERDSLQLGNINVRFGDVTLHIFPDLAIYRPKERTGALQPTDGAGIDHLAFSFRDLEQALERIQSEGVAIERSRPRDNDYRIESFFVRSPDGVLVELVKAKPLPEAAWE